MARPGRPQYRGAQMMRWNQDRAAILSFAVIAILAVASMAAFILVTSRDANIRDAETYVENHARISHRFAEMTLGQAHAILEASAALAARVNATPGTEPEVMTPLLRRLAEDIPRVKAAALLAMDGSVAAIFGESINPTVESDDLFFARFGRDDAWADINRRWVRPSGQNIVLDRILLRDMEAVGTLRVILDNRAFQEFLDASNVRAGSDLGFVNSDREIVIRHGRPLGQPVAFPITVAADELRASGGQLTRFEEVDGVERFAAYALTEPYGLVVFSALEAKAVFDSWWTNLAVFSAIVSVLTLGFFFLGQRALAAQRRQNWLAQVVESSGDAIWSRDIAGRIASWNRSAERLLGYSASEVIGRHISMLWPEPVRDEMASRVERGNNGDGFANDDTIRRHRSGSDAPVTISGSPIRDGGGRVIGASVTARDISEKKAVERRLHRLAYFDPLVELPNRVQLEDQIRQAVAVAAASGQAFALHYVDLDNFKDVNDSLGHVAGDGMLKEVARLLEALCQHGDSVGRLGGDEFGILQRMIRGPHESEQFAQRLVDTFAKPMRWSGHEVRIGVSVGIVNHTPLTDERDVDTAVGDLLRRADIAMYAAKHEGRNRWHLYEPSLGDRVQRRILIQAAVTRALRDGCFDLFYQPQVDLESGVIVGCEALLRWQDAELGPISPAEFIPVAEQAGVIGELGQWVIQRALSDLKSWGRDDVFVSVNVSAMQMRRGDFGDTVAQALARASVPPRLLELELTESAVFNNSHDGVETLRALRALGLRLAIDDFGTGYSSLSYLRDFPIDKLKIDRQFVTALEEGGNAAHSLIEAVCVIAKGHGLSAVAEGIETVAQRRALGRLGVHLGQGYLFSKAVPADDFVALLGRQHSASFSDAAE
jgi:diguanylate cyclase (GGDEF)-like protein/PAS domain S-box-containing protein